MASKAGIFDIRTWGPDRSTIPHLPHSSTPGLPVAASEIIYQGCLVAYDPAASEAVSAITTQAATAKVIGIAKATVDNRTGAKGDLTVEVQSGLIRLVNDGNITAAHLHKQVRLIDDHTAGVAAGTDADRLAGLLMALDSTTHVWVLVTPETALRAPILVAVTSTNGTAAAAIPGALTSANGVAAAAIPGALTSTDGTAAAAAADLAALAAEAEKIGDDVRAIHAAMLLAQAENEKIGDDARAIHAAALLAQAEAEKISDDVRAVRTALVTLGLIAPAA